MQKNEMGIYVRGKGKADMYAKSLRKTNVKFIRTKTGPYSWVFRINPTKAGDKFQRNYQRKRRAQAKARAASKTMKKKPARRGGFTGSGFSSGFRGGALETRKFRGFM